MDFQVLGPLRAGVGEIEVDLGGPKQRLVLAILLAMRGAAVSTDALIDGVWTDAPPTTARKTLQGYIHHLRGRIGGGLETNKTGYSLEIPDWRVDERRFCTSVEEARPLLVSDPLLASDLLSEALALWRGAPYADFAGALVLLPETTRLEETRLCALADRIDADLALGRHAALIGELESLTIDYPFHERFRGHLMVALYRTGRHGEALRAFSRTRDAFIEEMGLEPSDELRRLERQILDRDPALSTTVDHTPGAARAVRGYELREQVSTDESGSVYRGYQRSIGREVAIRVIGAHVADDPYFIANYESDIARVARLQHPNVLYVQDTWREPGRAYQVMRWIEGDRLDRYLSEHNLDNWSALEAIEQIDAALSAAHRNGVIHGDVSARNVVRSDTGTYYLTDFVVGRPRGTETADRTGFVCLAFHALFGLQPRTTGELSRLLEAAVTSRELRDAFAFTDLEPGEVCGDGLARRVRRALGGDVVELAGGSGPAQRTDTRCPYKGLHAFESADSEDFFGRDDLIDRLVSLVALRRLVAVVGPSGSGKSSLVKAGFLPRLGHERGRHLVAQMYPGDYPFDSLERALGSVAVVDTAIGDQLRSDARGLCRVLGDVLPDDSSDLVLVIDQFEEVFSAVESEALRALFLESLVEAVSDPESRLRVVLTLRADFFDRPLRYPRFGALVDAGLVPVAMLDGDVLGEVIERPAAAVGVGIQPGLTAEMIRDVADQPGGLPLLQYALTDLFDVREVDMLTIEAYRESGGVIGALGTRAEALFMAMSATGQRAMQQAFLRMVTVDEEVHHVRRRVTRSDLAALEVDRDALDQGLQRFGAHRLLTFDFDPVSRAPTVEVAHESLLREWGRLRSWIADQRDQLVIRKRLDAALVEWKGSGEDPAYLLRGRRLNEFDGWATETDIALGANERAFLQVSREHDEAQSRTAATRRRRVVTALAVTALVAIVFGFFGLVQRGRVADKAFAAETSRLGSDSGFVVESDRQMALLMAVETYRRDPGFEGRSALQRVLVDAGPYLGNLSAGREYRDVRWLADDRLIAATTDEIDLIDTGSREVTTLSVQLRRARVGDEISAILATAPVGLAAVATSAEEVVLVDGTDGSVDPLMPLGDIEAVAISDDGAALAIGRADGTLEIVDRGARSVTADVVANPPRDATGLDLPTGVTLDGGQNVSLQGIDGLAFNASGGLVVSSAGVFLRAWNADDLSPAGPEIVHAGGRDEFNRVATPVRTSWLVADENALVTAGDSFIASWDVSTGERLSLEAVSPNVIDATDGGNATAMLLSDDGSVVRHELDAAIGRESANSTVAFAFETQERSVFRIAVDPDGSRIAVASDDGIVLAALDGSRLIARAVPIGASNEPSISRDGTTLAAGLVSDGLFDLSVDPPRRRAFDTGVEVAQSAGSPASYELAPAGTSDVLLWTSTFMEMRNAYDLETRDYLGVFWGPYLPAWSDDGRRVFRRRVDGGTSVEESAGDEVLHQGVGRVDSADFDSTANQVILVGGEDSSTLVVDLETNERRPLPASPGSVVSAAFMPDDDEIVTVSSLGAVTILDSGTLAEVRRLEDARTVAGRPIRPPVVDMLGELMFSASDGRARLWDVESGRQLGKPLPVAAGGRPFAVADGETIRVVTPMAGNALIWNLVVDDWVDVACAAAGRNMTDTEWAAFGPRDTEARAVCPGT